MDQETIIILNYSTLIPFDLDYEVRPYRPGDEEQIVPLLQLVFNGWQDLNFFRWKYFDNPLKRNIICVALSNGRIIGFTASVFKRVKIGDKVFLSTYGTDAAVHPDFRRRGVHRKNTNLKDELRRKVGEHINYSATENPIIIKHPNSPRFIFPYHLRYFLRIRDMGLHNRFNPAKNMSERAKRLGLQTIKLLNDLRNTISPSPPVNKDIQVIEINRFDDRAEAFWDEVRDHYDFIVERTREHLNWNYCDARGGDFTVKLAEEDGRMLGYIVMKMGDGGVYPRGEVIDLLTVPGRLDVADALLADATGVFDDNGINFCSSRLLEGHPYESVFRRHGFFGVRRRARVHYYCYEMDEDFRQRVRETVEATAAERVHLSFGDFL